MLKVSEQTTKTGKPYTATGLARDLREQDTDRMIYHHGIMMDEDTFFKVLWINAYVPMGMRVSDLLKRYFPLGVPAVEKKPVLMLPATITPPCSSPQCLGGGQVDATPKVMSMPKPSRIGYRVNVPGWGRGVIVSDKTWEGATLYQIQGDYGVVWRRWVDLVVLDAGQAVVLSGVDTPIGKVA